MNKAEMLEWVNELNMGDYALDTHTKEFLRKTNEFLDARNVGNGEERIDSFLNYLTEYAQKNFAAQDELMQRIDYPSLLDHQEAHKEFIRNVAKLYKKRILLKRVNVPKDEYDERGIDGVLTDTSDFVRDWYHSHLLYMDKRLSDYYNHEYSGK
ncbi:MAG: hemerythrin family protein [Mucispirillum sp.]|nr:hemerythrin family protein [Mucispirillum sp.]